MCKLLLYYLWNVLASRKQWNHNSQLMNSMHMTGLGLLDKIQDA